MALEQIAEINLKFKQGKLQAVLVDGVEQQNICAIRIEAEANRPAKYWIEHSTVYLDLKR